MVYTPEEKEKMDRLVEAFHDYTRDHYYFDIGYSEKRGYLWIVMVNDADDDVMAISGYEELLYSFYDSIYNDRLDEQVRENGGYEPAKVDYDSIRRQVEQILQNFGEGREECLAALEGRIAQWEKE